ncbi:MAG TPA: tautomerase family protein [Methanocella sp.]|uniref:tautomerase family protein n=1 Tax=Methanocella sp. TaxID=2052833 RepID=UPI002B94E3DA|nr:tautomerase family protein [Methanocella sp.]HTY90357.1 tautomerase family protein [Methanocella sp.]
MPVVDVYMWSGRTPEQKKSIIKGITDVFVKEGVPAGAVTVILHDIPKENWGTAGKCADEA